MPTNLDSSLARSVFKVVMCLSTWLLRLCHDVTVLSRDGTTRQDRVIRNRSQPTGRHSPALSSRTPAQSPSTPTANNTVVVRYSSSSSSMWLTVQVRIAVLRGGCSYIEGSDVLLLDHSLDPLLVIGSVFRRLRQVVGRLGRLRLQ